MLGYLFGSNETDNNYSLFKGLFSGKTKTYNSSSKSKIQTDKSQKSTKKTEKKGETSNK